jgi:hypothetical protein
VCNKNCARIVHERPTGSNESCHIYAVLYLASKHLSGVRAETSEKIKQLNEELALIDVHLADQQTKQEEVSD